MRSTLWVPAAVLAAGLLCGCSTTQTKRLDVDQSSEIELGAVLTSQDFRSVAQRMARSLVQIEQIQNASTPPKVAFVSVANNSSEYVDGDSFLNKMRTELVKHAQGRIVFLDRSIIEVIEKENRDKSRGNRTASGEQTPYGADFFLTGTIESIDRVSGGGMTRYMRLSFRLSDAASSAVVWEDDYEIKKHSSAGIMYR